MKTQVEKEFYEADAYNSKPRLYSFVEQIHETLRLKPARVVEVGIGNRFTTRALQSAGVEVITVDFDASLAPDIVASVCDMPLPDGHVDASLCFQCLEHLPFAEFVPGLRELARVSKDYVFFSIPDCRPNARLEIGRGCYHQQTWRRTLDNLPWRKAPPHVYDGQHYWEIGKAQTPERVVVDAVNASGLTLLRHYRLPLNPYHHFFLLRKPNASGS